MIWTADVAGGRFITSLTCFGDGYRNIYQIFENGRNGSDHVVILLLVCWLVLIAEERVHRSQWPFARVLEVYPGRNGFVRSVKVATKSSTFTGPISKLCFLEQESLLPTKDSTYFTWLSCCLLKLKGLWICAPDVHALWTLADLLQRL